MSMNEMAAALTRIADVVAYALDSTPTLPDWITSIAGAVTAVTAFGAAIIGIIQFGHWKKQKRELSQAEVAAQALIALLRFLSQLIQNTSIAVDRIPELEVVAPDDPDADRKMTAILIDFRWTRFADFDDEFNVAWTQAEVFLPHCVADLFAEINSLRQLIESSQRMWVDHRNTEYSAKFYREGFGRKETINALRERAKTLLRPIAQLAARSEVKI